MKEKYVYLSKRYEVSGVFKVSCLRKNAVSKNCWKKDAAVQGRVILVDNIVDSKWTLTVGGRLLTLHGCGAVFPFCLADSSQQGADQ